MYQSKKGFSFLSVIALLLILVASSVLPAFAAVTLVGFTAIPVNGQVLVVWETATEVDNAGFFVYRSTNQNGGFEAVSSFIPAIGGSPTTGEYSFTDTRVTKGAAYYYELIASSTSNESQTFPPVGPIVPGVPTDTATWTSVVTRPPKVTGSTNAQTSTSTRTPTQIRNPTATQNGAYPGPVQSPNPTLYLTPTHNPETSVPTGAALTPETNATSANKLTQLDGPTSTLRPFPSVTYEFPDATQTPMISKQSTPVPGGRNGLSGWVNVVRLGPLALILLIWVLLGGWFYLTLRRME
jgi:hypothetical protein